MKKYFKNRTGLLFIARWVAIILVSCELWQGCDAGYRDPHNLYQFKNETETTLVIKQYFTDGYSDSITLEAGTFSDFKTRSCDMSDSLSITSNNVILKTYYPLQDTESKNPCLRGYYVKHKKFDGTNDLYLYTFTPEDFE